MPKACLRRLQERFRQLMLRRHRSSATGYHERYQQAPLQERLRDMARAPGFQDLRPAGARKVRPSLACAPLVRGALAALASCVFWSIGRRQAVWLPLLRATTSNRGNQ